jgi:hypothetical protein
MRPHCHALWVAFVACVASAAAYAGAAPKVDEAGNALDAFERTIAQRPERIDDVLKQYQAIEAAGKFDQEGRARIHAGLVAALRKVEDPLLASTADGVFDTWGNSQWPAKVVMLKTLLGDRFPMPREKRVVRLVSMARGSHFRLSIWGIRLLGDSRWPESVDALIEIMKTEEAKGRTSALLWNFVSAELYRVLGAEAPQGSTSARIETNWKKLGRKVPAKPDYSAPGDSGPTVAFFGDMISPRAIFLIDISSSMQQETTLAERTSRRSAAKDEGARRDKKVHIVTQELERCLGQLQSWYKFNLAGYHAKLAPWKRTLALLPANSANVDAARDFARTLETKQGTNIFESVKAALPNEELETIYLLSDGVPSVGGGPADIEKMVRSSNYLLGVRIITYGFAGDEKGGFDEGFMQRMAGENWGWYRRLNK